MLFPIRDENPLVRPPVATIVLIGINIACWGFLQGFGTDSALSASVCNFGLIPGDLLGNVPVGRGGSFCPIDGNGSYLTVVSSMFMHGGWMHLIGNMWFLWIFGDNVEDAMGPIRFSLFYLLCGLGAAGAQTATDPSSLIPMVGASGAIGGVMGAYALLFPRARILCLFIITTLSVPAILMLGYWVLIQFLGSMQSSDGGGGVAFWAHIGGFAAGALLVWPFRNQSYVNEHLSQPRRETARHRFL